MSRMRERGDSRISSLIFFALLIAAGLAAWNVIPVYWQHYDFTDAVEQICRTPKYKARTDEIVKGMLMKEVRERRLGEWVGPDSFQISTTDSSRVIKLHYERKAKVLPGWDKLFIFDYTADQPLI